MSAMVQVEAPAAAAAAYQPGVAAGAESCSRKESKARPRGSRAVSKALSGIKRTAGSVFGGGRSGAASPTASVDSGALPVAACDAISPTAPPAQDSGVAWPAQAGGAPPGGVNGGHPAMSHHLTPPDQSGALLHLNQMHIGLSQQASATQALAGYSLPTPDHHDMDEEEGPQSRRSSMAGSYAESEGAQSRRSSWAGSYVESEGPSRRPSLVGSFPEGGSEGRKKIPGQQITVTHDYHDYSIIPDEEALKDIVKRKNTGGVVTPFPEKLHELLSYKSDRDVIDWAPHGRCFIIKKPKIFAATLMPQNFKHGKFTSFQRQLNLYGFKRITRGKDRGAYYHELFLRGRPRLCMKMRRMKVKGNGQKPLPDPENEPDFYSMTVMDDPPPSRRPITTEDEEEVPTKPKPKPSTKKVQKVIKVNPVNKDAKAKSKARASGPGYIIERTAPRKSLKMPSAPLQVTLPVQEKVGGLKQDSLRSNDNKLLELMEAQRKDLERRYREFQCQQRPQLNLQQYPQLHLQQQHHLHLQQQHHLAGPSGISSQTIVNAHSHVAEPAFVSSHWNTNQGLGASQMAESAPVGASSMAHEEAPMSLDAVNHINTTSNTAMGNGVTDMEIDDPSTSRDQMPPPSYQMSQPSYDNQMPPPPYDNQMPPPSLPPPPSYEEAISLPHTSLNPKTSGPSKNPSNPHPSNEPSTNVHNDCERSLGFESDGSPHTEAGGEQKSLMSSTSFGSSTTGSKGQSALRRLKGQGLFLRRSVSSNGSDSWIDEEQRHALEANIDFDGIFEQS